MNFRVQYQGVVGVEEVSGDGVLAGIDKATVLRDFIMDLHRRGITGVRITWCQPTSRPVGAVNEPGREGRATMGDAKDPRTDRSSDGPKQPVPQGSPHDAPGGAGTGTKGDPAKEPAAQPDAGSSRR